MSGDLKLNLGCGSRKMEGYVNIDRSPLTAPDLLLDLEQVPWPFEADSVAEIQALHVLEHVGGETEQFLAVLREMYRVCRDDALINIVVPHHRSESFAGDPTHVRAITAKGMCMFSKDYCRAFAENGWPNTPLAEFLDIDLGLARIVYHLTDYWRRQSANGMDAAELLHAVTTYNNVVEQVTFEVRVVKSPATQDKIGHTDGNYRCELR
jgi:hypothetical protein